MYSADHNEIVQLSWRVQNFVVTGYVYFKLEHCKWSNFEFERNIVSGTGAWSGTMRLQYKNILEKYKQEILT